jgi:hypothetical protein
MAKLGKAQHQAFRSVCSLGKYVYFSATPYEGQTSFGGSHNDANPIGYSWAGHYTQVIANSTARPDLI